MTLWAEKGEVWEAGEPRSHTHTHTHTHTHFPALNSTPTSWVPSVKVPKMLNSHLKDLCLFKLS